MNAKKTINWFEQTLMSRLNDRKNDAIILVMQRLHVDDLSRHLIKNGEWKVLSLPIIADKETRYKCANYIYQRKAKEILHNKRYNSDMIQQLKLELGEYAFNAQYKQNPSNIESNFIKKSWFKYFYSKELDFKNMNNLSKLGLCY